MDINAGILYSGSSTGTNNYYLGASIYHINHPSLSFIDKVWNLSSRVTIHGGYSFPVSNVLSVNASIIQQIQNNASEILAGAALSANLNGDTDHPSNLYFGSWIRMNDALIPYVGIEVKGLRIGASYDINTSSLKAATASRGGAEFSLIYIKKSSHLKDINTWYYICFVICCGYLLILDKQWKCYRPALFCNWFKKMDVYARGKLA